MKHIRGMLFPLLIILLWQMGSSLELFNSFIVPSPAKVLKTAFKLLENGSLMKHLWVSVYRVFSGFIIAFLMAFPLAVLLGLNHKLHPYMSPTLEFIRHIPPISMIPLLILWFGIGETSKLAVIVLATFFPIFVNTFSGIRNSQIELEEVGLTFAFSRWQIFYKIILPQSLPSVMTGIQLGLGYSWRSLMGAELIAASSGIGYMIIEAEQLSRIDIIFVGVILIGALGCSIDYIFMKLTQRFFSWEVNSNGRDSDSATIQIVQT